MSEEAQASLVLLLSVTAIVLVIACANIANLLLARSAARASEMAVRLSIGASRRHLLTQLLTESCLLALIALSMALLVASGLFIRSLANVSRAELGMVTEDIVTFGLAPVLNGYEPDRIRALYARVEERLAALLGVTAASPAAVPVFAGNNWGNGIMVEGFEAGPDTDRNSRLNMIGSNYFRTLGIPLLAGRDFTDTDTVETPKVAIVNEAFVRKFGLDDRVVGTRMGRGGLDVELDIEIVGLVRDAKYSEVKQPVPPMFFVPYRQNAELRNGLTFYVRTAQADSLMAVIPKLVADLDAALPVNKLKTLPQQVRENVFLDRMISLLSTAFAALATLLVAVGLYGVLAYTVAQRTREFGLRMALGANGPRLRALVMWQVARMALAGIVIGLAAGLTLGRVARSLLYELGGADPMVVIVAVVVLSAVAFAAGPVPARRASRIDPMRALRYE